MGILLTMSAYAVLVIFLGVSFTRFLELWKAAETTRRFSPVRIHAGPLSFLRTAGDIIFLGRLLRTNDLLWLGEWPFHCFFVLVLLRHLRFVLNPVPEWIWNIQPFGLVAGYLLPVTLLYIFVVKMVREKRYFPSYNLFLIILIFLIAVTGLLMRTVFRTDMVAIKRFMTGIFTFSPMNLPEGTLFIVHFALVLLLAASLPSHIFAAPFVMIEARRREEELKVIIHDR
jgi:nitrate reductase gamma subunit